MLSMSISSFCFASLDLYFPYDQCRFKMERNHAPFDDHFRGNFEHELQNEAKLLSAEKLKELVKKTMANYQQPPPKNIGYLPGLVPEKDLKSYEELEQDIRNHLHQIKTSRFYQFMGNIQSGRQWIGYSLELPNYTEQDLRDYIQSTYEASWLEELFYRVKNSVAGF